jgi:hypothetical protein
MLAFSEISPHDKARNCSFSLLASEEEQEEGLVVSLQSDEFRSRAALSRHPPFEVLGESSLLRCVVSWDA